MIKTLMQQIVNLDFDARVEKGRKAVDGIIAVLNKQKLNPDQQKFFIESLAKLFVSADHKCSQAEYKLYVHILKKDISYEEFFEITNHGADSKFVENLDSIIDQLSGEEKTPICIFGLCLLASDDKITVEEQKLFNRILAE